MQISVTHSISRILLLIIVSGNGQVKITPDREKDFFYKFFRKELALDP